MLVETGHLLFPYQCTCWWGGVVPAAVGACPGCMVSLRATSTQGSHQSPGCSSTWVGFAIKCDEQLAPVITETSRLNLRGNSQHSQSKESGEGSCCRISVCKNEGHSCNFSFGSCPRDDGFHVLHTHFVVHLLNA